MPRYITFGVLAALFAGCEKDDAPAEPQFEPLIAMDWTLEPGTEAYRCKTVTVAEDMVVGGFRAVQPLGTHHTVLTRGPVDRADEEWDCYFADEKPFGVVGSGIASDDFILPDGVGMPLSAGEQLMLSLHLFNAGDQVLNGTSGTEVMVIEDYEFEAENTAAANFILDVEPGDGQTAVANCSIKEPGTITHWWPHMHQLGVHARLELNGEVILDVPYSFTEQHFYPVDLDVDAGDQLSFTCTYDNPTGETVHFGGSSNDEMCFLGFWRYPAIGEAFCDVVTQ